MVEIKIIEGCVVIKIGKNEIVSGFDIMVGSTPVKFDVEVKFDVVMSLDMCMKHLGLHCGMSVVEKLKKLPMHAESMINYPVGNCVFNYTACQTMGDTIITLYVLDASTSKECKKSYMVDSKKVLTLI